mgnify:FL=1
MFHRKINMIYLCILFGVFLSIGIGISNHKKWATSWSEYDLSIFELYFNIKKANAGDAKAAYALGMYYSFIKNNDKEALLWFERSAANNFPPALYELITYYSLISEPDTELQRKGKECYDKLIFLKSIDNLAAEYYDKLSDKQKIMFE